MHDQRKGKGQGSAKQEHADHQALDAARQQKAASGNETFGEKGQAAAAEHDHGPEGGSCEEHKHDHATGSAATFADAQHPSSCSGDHSHADHDHAPHSSGKPNHSHAHHGHGHHHHHGHGHHGHHHHGRAGDKKGLTIALGITASILVLEFVGGLWTRSLALLSDSGHMLSDAASLLLSLIAIGFAARPASKSKTYGFHRFEILAALFNGVTLFVIAGFIMWEAWGRFFDPPQVASGSMMLIASVGLIANLLSAWALMRQGNVNENVNLRSAYLHVLGDALGSVGAIVAGIVMMVFGWYAADPLISVLVALLILKGAWGVIAHAVHVLMEGTPPSIDAAEVRQALEGIDGVADVHDLHIWTITSGLDSLSCHLRIGEGTEADSQTVLQTALRIVEDRFGIGHATIQVETAAIRHGELTV